MAFATFLIEEQIFKEETATTQRCVGIKILAKLDPLVE